MKCFTFLFFLLFIVSFGQGQTLFTYGKEKVSRQEFLTAYHKNYTESVDFHTSITDYLELYTRFKLKVKAAYDERMDTLPNQRADMLGFRRQIEEPYMTDTLAIKGMVEEAFVRSRKEIGLSHIFIPFRSDFRDNPNSSAPVSKADSLAAEKKIKEISDRLKAGEKFEELALMFSLDQGSASKGGKLGYITVFTLPYSLENVAYSLGNQQVSEPILSAKGYHIFKKTSEQAARGRIKAEQILIAFEPDASPAQKAISLKLADSLYDAILSGSNFEDLARQFSNDKMTLATGGLMPEFGIGQFDPEFEDKVFSLAREGAVSRPIETSFGYHLVKKIESIPVEKDKKIAYPLLKAAVLEDARSRIAHQSFEKQVLSKVGYKKALYDPGALWRMTDSFIIRNKRVAAGNLEGKSTLFSFSKRKITVNNWLDYARENGNGEGAGTYPSLMQQFTTASSIDYYRDFLQDFSPEFNAQVQEFSDGNLLFEVMEKKVWNKAATDTAGLRSYYEKNKLKYQWGPSAGAIIFNVSEKKTAEDAQKFMQKNPAGWRSLMESSGGLIVADSGRFELTQLSTQNPGIIKTGFISSIQENDLDKSVSFYYIVNVYTNPAARNYDDARGLVMNDYQIAIEEKWIDELKKKYPVVVNQQVWKEILAGQ